MKKFISFILALCMIFSLGINVFAATMTPAVDKIAIKAGEEVKVTLTLDADINNVGGFEYHVYFDTAKFEFVSGATGDSFPGATITNLKTNAKGSYYGVTFTDLTSTGVTMEDGTLATFIFKAKTDITESADVQFELVKEVLVDVYADPIADGNLSANTVTVTVEPKPVVKGYLSNLKMGVYTVASPDDFVLTPAFEGTTCDYIAEVLDTVTSTIKFTATLSDTAPEDSVITVTYPHYNTNNPQTKTLISGKQTNCNNALSSGAKNNTFTITVGVTGDEQVYTVTTKKIPTLKGIEATGAKLNESFAAATLNYTATTAADSITLEAIPNDENYTVTYNGNESGVIALNEGANVITIVVTNTADNTSRTYTLTVNRVDKIELTFKTSPKNTKILLKDSFGDEVAVVDGKCNVMVGGTYTYTATAKGYISEVKNISYTENAEVSVALTKAAENPAIDKTIDSEWPNFRGENNLGITDAKTPYAPEDAELLWAAKYGTGWAAAPGSPIIVDDCIVTYVGNSIKKLDKNTGEVVAEGEMVAKSSYSIVPATYSEGVIYVGLANGTIQAFNADTLESLWVYKDPLKGQPNSTIAFADGYAYVGFWNSEVKDANFVCIDTTDEDPTNATEEKVATWSYTRAGGFYWAGALTKGNFVLVCTDDGQSGNTSETASFIVFNKDTGEIVDSWDGIRGDLRSNVSYDPASDRVFFTSKGGVLCNAKVDWETGKISSKNSIVITNAKGTEYAMCTSTPAVYNGRIYIGVSGDAQFGANTGHGISVYSFDKESGVMAKAYTYEMPAYPQTSAMVTTAYAGNDGYVYIYLPYNGQPGGISVLKDKAGQTEPLTTTDEGYSEVFTPVSPLNQYCICSAVADSYGTIFYKNDSCYMMAITSKILDIEITEYPTSIVKNEDGTYTMEGLKVVSNLANGEARDVTDYVEIKDVDDEINIIYTYGLDDPNYGLKTKRIVLPKEFLIKFDDGMGNITDKTVEIAGKVGEFPNVKRSGYVLQGWYDENGNKVTEETIVRGNTTYTAKWRRNTCDHDLDKNGKCRKCGITIISYENGKPVGETNPNTGAPAFASASAIIAVAVLGAATLIIRKRK